jgi:hypothetical protein
MTDLRINEDATGLSFVTRAGAPVGRYVLNDSHKPYLHPLHTPLGRSVSAAITHDHKHHKGLMYALRSRDLNFWEERSTLPGERVGRQRQTALTMGQVEGAEVSFVQQLLWAADDGDAEAFTEARFIACRALPDRFVWTWRTRLTALRDLELIKSQWSAATPDGRTINYHGLGLRFPRSFGGMQTSSTIAVDGESATFPDAMGTVPKAVTLTGAYDGMWPPARAGVTMRQFQRGTVFALRDPFAYLSMGPTNAEPMQIGRGEVIAETYEIEVFDAPPASA